MMSMLSLEIGNVFEGVEFLGAPAEAMRAKPTIALLSVLFNSQFFSRVVCISSWVRFLSKMILYALRNSGTGTPGTGVHCSSLVSKSGGAAGPGGDPAAATRISQACYLARMYQSRISHHFHIMRVSVSCHYPSLSQILQDIGKERFISASKDLP